MSDFFGGLRSGVQFPQVVMNQGPLPGAGGLPQPLHDTPDARINYGSSLLGDLTPYAYGEPGYLSSQNAYLNIPHKIQKIVPVVYLPEARNPARDTVDVSHPIDDADLAFVLRLDRNSMFCTGMKNAAMRRAGLGTAIDPLINLCTLNYILSGMQLGVNNEPNNLWVELLSNLDRKRFAGMTGTGRDYEGADPINVGDIVHVIRNCIRPFGITRGSEKQGGQDEATLGAATWPVSFIVSLTIDGKESNVLNIWHNHELHAGNDLVLRLKPMPVRPYTLNHYYKSVKRQAWETRVVNDKTGGFVWQLVPDLFDLGLPGKEETAQWTQAFEGWNRRETGLTSMHVDFPDTHHDGRYQPNVPLEKFPLWQELGFWHIGRAQVQTGKYGNEEYWHNDLANNLRTNHLDITFQPMFQSLPHLVPFNPPAREVHQVVLRGRALAPVVERGWEPSLRLEQLAGDDEPQKRARFEQEEPPPPPPAQQPVVDAEPDWLGRLEFSDEIVPEEPASSKAKKGGKRRAVGGSLLRADGTTEPSLVGML